MALPKLKVGDIIEISFKNLDKLYVDKTDKIYASRKLVKNCKIKGEWGLHFLFTGGKVHVAGVDKTTVHLSIDEHGWHGKRIRVQRYFIDSVKIIERTTSVKAAGVTLKIPSDASKGVRVGGHGDLTPGRVRTLLADMKKFYISPKKKAKKKPKKQPKPKVHKAGTKITKALQKKVTDHRHDLQNPRFNVVAIEWDESPEDLSAGELFLLYNGKVKGVDVYWTLNGGCMVAINGRFERIREDLIASITFAKDWTEPAPAPAPAPEREHPQYGLRLKSAIFFRGHRIHFYEKGLTVGCQHFQIKDIKKAYQALRKVYGTPK